MMLLDSILYCTIGLYLDKVPPFAASSVSVSSVSFMPLLSGKQVKDFKGM